MAKIFLAAVVIVALMAAVKDGRLLRESGLLSSCAAIATPLGQTGFWEACQPGRLEGRPDLSRRSCTRAGILANVEYWRCPARVASSNTPD